MVKKIRLKIWGARGSIPVSGKDYLVFGGESSCYQIETAEQHLIIDAGTGIRALGLELIKAKLKKPIHLFLTHYHLDHIIGLPYFRPLYLKNYPIFFHLPKFSAKNPRKILENFMAPPYFPRKLAQLPAELEFHSVSEKAFKVGDVKIIPKKLQHPNGSFGYRFDFSTKKSIALATDNEILAKNLQSLIKWCHSSDILIHDTQYTKAEYVEKIGWGHSSIDNVFQLSKNAHVKKVLLSHHNPLRTDNDFIDLQRKILKQKNIHNHKIDCQFVRQFDEFFV